MFGPLCSVDKRASDRMTRARNPARVAMASWRVDDEKSVLQVGQLKDNNKQLIDPDPDPDPDPGLNP